MKIVDVPTFVVTSKERGKIVHLVNILCNIDNEAVAFLDGIMEEMLGYSLLGILEEILNRVRVSN